MIGGQWFLRFDHETGMACQSARCRAYGKAAMPTVTRLVERYGAARLQHGEWVVPSGVSRCPTVVLVHGGFWRKRYHRSLEDEVASDLASRGYLVWNIDYRSSALPWPTTLTDVAAAYDHLTIGRYADRVDPDRIACVGHSAGGHLAAWLAARHRLPPTAPGHRSDLLVPAMCVPQSGVVCLTRAAEQGLGSAAPQALLGGSPHDVPERYAVADPFWLIPTGVPSRLIHTADDDTVPVSQSGTYAEAAAASGDDSRVVVVPGDHYAHLDPGSAACHRLRESLAAL